MQSLFSFEQERRLECHGWERPDALRAQDVARVRVYRQVGGFYSGPYDALALEVAHQASGVVDVSLRWVSLRRRLGFAEDSLPHAG